MPDDDDEADKYELADALLGARRDCDWYEVSNWSTSPATRCRHNIGYWQAATGGVSARARTATSAACAGGTSSTPAPTRNGWRPGVSPAAAREVLDDGAAARRARAAGRPAARRARPGRPGRGGPPGRGRAGRRRPARRPGRDRTAGPCSPGAGRLLADTVVRAAAALTAASPQRSAHHVRGERVAELLTPVRGRPRP